MTKEEMYESLKDSAKEWVSSQVILINKEVAIWAILIALSLITPILACFFKPSSETLNIWFQRSGAITVVLSLLAEIKSNSIEKIAIVKEHTFLYCNMYLKSCYEFKVKIINYSTYLVVAIGTIIWGYGDLLISATFN
jgi:hypothetical protein